MCTCITYENGDFYFGRNLDLEYAFGEKVVVTPRNYPFSFQCLPAMNHHYAMIGMATVMEDFPLYAEAVNEKGLGIAGLNFPESACYKEKQEGKKNVAPFELIPWILGQCESTEQAEKLLENCNLLNHPFRKETPLSPLHWMVADKNKCIVIEAVKEGVRIYDNPYGVLTNNPPFPFYQMYMQHYRSLSAKTPESLFAESLSFKTYGQGMGAMGLPGDYSPASRFVKAAFLKLNSRAVQEEEANVSQFFHILDGVSMVRGAVITPEGKEDITTYSCCINGDQGIYYYKTYDNSQIHAISLQRENLEETGLKEYALCTAPSFQWQN